MGKPLPFPIGSIIVGLVVLYSMSEQEDISYIVLIIGISYILVDVIIFIKELNNRI